MAFVLPILTFRDTMHMLLCLPSWEGRAAPKSLCAVFIIFYATKILSAAVASLDAWSYWLAKLKDSYNMD